jgi:hypothetical protein
MVHKKWLELLEEAIHIIALIASRYILLQVSDAVENTRFLF